jgi:hypothetical protein
MDKQYLLILFCIPFLANAQFNVGNSDGFASSCYMQADFPIASIYSVGNDDGFAKDCHTQNDYPIASIYTVGNDDGFAKDCYIQNDYPIASIYSVGNDDGFVKDCYIQNDFPIASIYSVGNDDGFGKSCLGSLNNEVPLPIELLSFAAECNDQNIVLRWVTLTEKNNAFFTIEKSKDASNWEEISKINGAGFTNQIKEYTYIDEKLESGVIYYRLKQTDFDGTYKYFDIIAVNCRDKTRNNFKIYPNPFYNQLTIEITDNENDEALVEIMNKQGSVIFQSKFRNKIIIPTNDISDAIYIVRITTNYDVIHQKVVKQ